MWHLRLGVLAVMLAGCDAFGIGSPDSFRVDITFAGDGAGFVGFSNRTPSATGFFPIELTEPPCRTSCTRWFEPGTPVFAVAGTASRFDGFSECGPDRVCPTILDKDTALTATFSRSSDEQFTLYPEVPATAGSFADDNDLLVGGSLPGMGGPDTAVVSRLSPTGAVRWSYAVPGLDGTCMVKGGPNGDVYAVATHAGTPASLIALTSDGQLRWSQDLGSDPRSCTLAFDSGGNIVTNGYSGTSETLVKVSPSGTVQWSHATTNGFFIARDRAVTIDSAGTIAQLEFAQQVPYVARYASDGTSLAPWPLPPALTSVDSPAWGNAIATGQGGVAVQIMFGRSRSTAALDGTGEVVFTRTDPLQVTGFALDIENDPKLGISQRSDGELFMWLPHVASWDYGQGYHVDATLQRLTLAGAETWTTELLAAQRIKPGRAGGLPMDAQQISSSACDNAGHCALFGEYVGVGAGPWIQIFRP